MTKAEILQMLKKEINSSKYYKTTLMELTKISGKTFYKILKGESEIKLDSLLCLCDLLGLEVVIKRKGGKDD